MGTPLRPFVSRARDPRLRAPLRRFALREPWGRCGLALGIWTPADCALAEVALGRPTMAASLNGLAATPLFYVEAETVGSTSARP